MKNKLFGLYFALVVCMFGFVFCIGVILVDPRFEAKLYYTLCMVVEIYLVARVGSEIYRVKDTA